MERECKKEAVSYTHQKIYVKEKPDTLLLNQRYIREGFHSKFYSSSSGCENHTERESIFITNILTFLTSIGYEIEDTSKFSMQAKEALKDLQKRNNISTGLGHLDFETIKYIEALKFIPRLISIGYKIDSTICWSDKATKSLLDFQVNNELRESGKVDPLTTNQMDKVELIPLLIEVGYDISTMNMWNDEANEALIDYQIKHNLLMNVGQFDYSTQNHLKNKILIESTSR